VTMIMIGTAIGTATPITTITITTNRLLNER
jgi:hypothetical protein